MTSISIPTIDLTITSVAPSMERDLTAKNYTGDADNLWHGGILGGILVTVLILDYIMVKSPTI